MDPQFWHARWANEEVGFHLGEANPQLVRHVDALSISAGDRVFLPLCGKTLDIGWLLSRGYRVAGAELSRKAVEQLFEDLSIEAEITPVGDLTRYSAEGLDVFVGNIFDLSPGVLGPVDAVYDRAALVALPEDMRGKYTAHMMDLTGKAPQLLVSFAYDQAQMNGPPFAVHNDEIHGHYQDHYELTHLQNMDMPGGLKGQCPAQENTWLLTQKQA